MSDTDFHFPRAAGLLIHPTSLPSPHGIGSLGPETTHLFDWMARAGLTLWQVLPLVPVKDNGSPYATSSAFSGNPLLIDLVTLLHDGLLDPDDCLDPGLATDRVDYAAVAAFKLPRLHKAAARLVARAAPRLAAFRAAQPWVEDAALFSALKDKLGPAAWTDWPAPLRDRDPAALAAARAELADTIQRDIAIQFLFDTQWQAVRAAAHARGIQILGDLPIYVDHDSADVWAARDQFLLDDAGHPLHVAGVPPDYFSESGQRWGNPLYDWPHMARDHHRWWVRRIRRALHHCDLIRIDHFRAFAAYWEVPATSPDARAGRWVQGPGRALFDDLSAALGTLPIVAEDLGDIDQAVHDLRDAVGLPGMLVLQFGFVSQPDHPFLPHNHLENRVVYTGTHDNDTSRGWYQKAPESERDFLRRYLAVPGHDAAWDLIRAAMRSAAHTAIVPVQDILNLDSAARMNTPGLADGNWSWRLPLNALAAPEADRLRELIWLYGRLPG